MDNRSLSTRYTAQPNEAAFPVQPTSSVSEGSGFTPGPWFVCGDLGYPPQSDSWREGRTIGSVPDGTRICDLTPLRVDWQNEANARLIAAAPDLYAAAMCLPLHWLKQGILAKPTSDELRIEVRIVGTSYEAEMTVGDLRAAAAALSLAAGSNPHV